MAAECKDWIGGTVYKELELALEWSKLALQEKRGHEIQPSLSDFEDIYQDDRSTLRVNLGHSITESRAVQIVKVGYCASADTRAMRR